MSYPRHWHWVFVRLERFDHWLDRRTAGKRSRPFWIALALPVFLVVRFLGLVVVLEIAIIALAASLYLVYGEWLALLFGFPFVLAARAAHIARWPLAAWSGGLRWVAHVPGWQASAQTLAAAQPLLMAGRDLPGTVWEFAPRRSRLWM